MAELKFFSESCTAAHSRHSVLCRLPTVQVWNEIGIHCHLCLQVWCQTQRSRLTLVAIVLAMLFTFASSQSAAGPVWDVTPRNQTQRIGLNTSLYCSISNSSGRSLSWIQVVGNRAVLLFVNNMNFQAPQRYHATSDADGSSTLHLTQLLREDDALYKCDVQNSNLSATAQVTVLVNPDTPIITLNTTEEDLIENAVIQFICSSSGGNPAPTMKWFRNGVQLSNVSFVPPTTKFGTSSSVLMWRLSRADFRANFSCTAENTEIPDSLVANWTSILVKYAPVIALGSYNPLIVVEKSPMRIDCNVTAYPEVIPSNIFWYKDGQLIKNGSSLTKTSVTVIDAGVYTCSARNFDVRTANLTLDVQYPPRTPSFRVVTAKEGLPANLSIDFDANPPVNLSVALKWYKGDALIQSGGFLLIQKVARSDGGNYTVEATNFLTPSAGAVTVGTGQGTLQLKVSYKPGRATITVPAVVLVGQDANLGCTIDSQGDPIADLIWSRSGWNNTYPKGSVLQILNARLSDIGNYSCLPVNDVGSGQSDTKFLDIYEPAQWIQTTLPSKMDVLINATPEGIVCQARGRPAPTVRWYKDGRSVDTLPEWFYVDLHTQPLEGYSWNVTSTLKWKGTSRNPTTYSLRPDDAGIYTCQASVSTIENPVNQTMELVIRYSPLMANSSVQLGADPGTAVVLICDSRGFPPPSFVWHRGTRALESGDKYQIQSGPNTSRLTITGMSSEDVDNYSCEANNTLGSSVMTFNLTLNSVPNPPMQLKVISQTWESVELRWMPGYDGGCPQEFLINCQGRSQVAAGSTPWYNLTGLYPNTTYVINVQPKNRLGVGRSSNSLSHTTDGLIVAAPVNVQYHKESKLLTCRFSEPQNSCLQLRVLTTTSSDTWHNSSKCGLPSDVSLKLDFMLQDAEPKMVEVSTCLKERPDICSSPQNADFVNDLPVRLIVIVCCVCGGFIVILLIILIVVCCYLKKKRKAYADEQHAISGFETHATQTEKDEFQPDIYGIDNPALHQMEPSSDISYSNKGAFLNLEYLYPLDQSDSHGSYGSDSGVSVSEAPKTKRIIHEVIV